LLDEEVIFPGFESNSPKSIFPLVQVFANRKEVAPCGSNLLARMFFISGARRGYEDQCKHNSPLHLAACKPPGIARTFGKVWNNLLYRKTKNCQFSRVPFPDLRGNIRYRFLVETLRI
jgi:hypothetical protein